jgi:Zn-dependent protease with chaperone function
MIKFTNFAKLLAYLGAIPFIACACLRISDLILLTYGLTIASFMAGTHWGLCLKKSDNFAHGIFLASIIVTLSAWFCYLLCSAIICLLIFAGIFISLMFIDYLLYRKNLESKDYFQLRLSITTIVVVSLITKVLYLYLLQND